MTDDPRARGMLPAPELVAPPVTGEVAEQVEGQLGPDELPDPGEVTMNTEAKLRAPHEPLHPGRQGR